MTKRLSRYWMDGIAAVLIAVGGPAYAEEGSIRIAEQFGIPYLPLHVLRDQKLIESEGQARGVEITVEWAKLSGGSALNDALLSGSIDIAAGGVTPLLTIWDRTRGSSLEVKGVAALAAMPYYLVTNNPEVTKLEDFGPGDRIAVPTVGVSIQARTLQMAVAKIWGQDQFAKLDPLTVSLPNPDATTALLSGSTEVTAHFSVPPFQFQQLQDPKIRKVLDSFEVLGGPGTSTLLWATSGYREDSPQTYAAFLAALEKAVAFIEADKAAAADTYIRVEKSKIDREFLLSILNDPQISYGLTPQATDKFATFMADVGAIKSRPAGWKDYFFEDLHDLPGS